MGLRRKKKDKKKKEVVEEVIEEPVVEPEPEPIPEPEPEPTPEPEPEPPPPPPPILEDGVDSLWKSVTLETNKQIADLFNSIEAKGFTVVDYDFEYNFRQGTIEGIYKVKRG